MPGNARNLYTRHEPATARLFLQFLSFVQSIEFPGLCYFKQWSCGFFFFFCKQLDTHWRRKDTKADGQERTHWPVFKNSLAKHGAKARWPLRLWLNYCLNYIRALCHSLLTFICTTDRCSWLFLKYSFLDIARYLKSRWINFLSERFKTIVSGLNLGVT